MGEQYLYPNSATYPAEPTVLQKCKIKFQVFVQLCTIKAEKYKSIITYTSSAGLGLLLGVSNGILFANHFHGVGLCRAKRIWSFTVISSTGLFLISFYYSIRERLLLSRANSIAKTYDYTDESEIDKAIIALL